MSLAGFRRIISQRRTLVPYQRSSSCLPWTSICSLDRESHPTISSILVTIAVVCHEAVSTQRLHLQNESPVPTTRAFSLPPLLDTITRKQGVASTPISSIPCSRVPCVHACSAMFRGHDFPCANPCARQRAYPYVIRLY